MIAIKRDVKKNEIKQYETELMSKSHLKIFSHIASYSHDAVLDSFRILVCFPQTPLGLMKNADHKGMHDKYLLCMVV